MPLEDGHSCAAPASVIVDGTGIPIIDEGVTVYERKDGPLAMSRRAEVTFPISAGDKDWINEIDAYKDGGDIQQAEVYMQPLDINGNPAVEEEILVLRGFISAVGSRGGANKGQITIMGPFKYVNKIPAANTFGDNVTAKNILQWVVDEFESGQPVFDDVTLGDVYVPEIEEGRKLLQWGQQVSWTPNRDTLADVLETVANWANLSIWFEPKRGGGIKLQAKRSLGENFDAADDNGDLSLIHNNALYQLQPFNALTLKGSNKHVINLGDYGTVQTPFGTGDYVEATAEYPPLVERASMGGQVRQVGESKFGSKQAVESDAEKRLKEMLDDVSGGTMDMALAPHVSPYDTIDARPACAGTLDIDVPELTYEVQRTAHTLAPSNPGADPQIPNTEVAVSIEIDPEKIVSDSTTLNAQPSKQSDNKPPDEDPSKPFSWGIGLGPGSP